MRKIKSIAMFLVATILLASNINMPTVFAVENSVSIFEGKVQSAAWNMATSVRSTKNGGTLDTSIFKDKGYFYIEYSGEKDGMQLILQSWSGGEGWALANPSEVGVTEDNLNYAKFDESSVKAAYKSDLTTTLDALHVWNTKGSFTLESIEYVTDNGVSEEIEKDPVVTDKEELKVVEPIEANVRYLGRAYNFNNELWLAPSASGAEFIFTGTTAEVTFLGDWFADGENINNARAAVYVDDKLVVDKMITEPETTVKVFESQEVQTVKITIRKLSETVTGTLGVKNIKINKDGIIKRSEAKSRLIEFIGDSITCGYGVEDEDCNHTFKTSTENVTKTYAYKTAQALDSDINVTAYSGYGIVSGASAVGVKNPDQLLPEHYNKVGYSYGGFASQLQPQSLEWDFKEQPDVVVINLGTNDSNYCNTDERKTEFMNEYINFLKTVREKNPNAKLVCGLGIMGDSLFDTLDLAVNNYKVETGDLDVYSLEFDIQSYLDGFAADWHPTEKTHGKAAVKLTDKIKEIMNW